MAEQSLKDKTVKGVLWSGVERFSTQGVNFLIMLIIARIVSPSDYGLVGMLAVFIAVSQSLVDSGFSQALIRKNERSEVDINTVYYFNLLVSISIYILLFFFSPLVASFFNEPQLDCLLKVLSLVVVVNAFAVVQRALYVIAIDFKTQTKATLIAAVASGIIGIILAGYGYGVWALVFQQLSNSLISTILLWLYSTWRPKLLFSWISFHEMFSFGSKMLLSGLLNTLYNHIYQIVIGKAFSASSLGYYTRAHQFANMPSSSLTDVLQRVVFPVLCKLQDDKIKYKEVTRKFLSVSVFAVVPLMCLIAGISKPMVIVLLGEKWAYTADLLIPLCFALMLYPMHAINLNVITVIGRSDLFLKIEIIKKIIGVSVLAITIPFGLLAMCYGAIVGSILGLFVNSYYTKREIGYGIFTQFIDVFPVMALSLILFVITKVVSNVLGNSWSSLIVSSLVGATFFIIIAAVFRFKELHYIKKMKISH